MSLADHYDNQGPGKYLHEGWHEVVVADYRVFDYGTPTSDKGGVEFIMKDTAEKQTKATFNLLDRCLWDLANFAKACGLTREQCAKYDPHKESSHRMLLGKRLKVHVVKDGDFHKANEWANINENVSDAPAPVDERLKRPQEPQPAPPTGAGIPF